MGYFANGTDGESYQNRYCFTCRNWRETPGNEVPGCVIWDMHLLFNYEQCAKDFTKALGSLPVLHGPTLAEMLGNLIPRATNGDNLQCLMYLPGPDLELEEAGQLNWLEVATVNEHG